MGITFRDPQHWLSTSVDGTPRSLEAQVLKAFGALKGASDRGRATNNTLYVNVQGASNTKEAIQAYIRRELGRLGVSKDITILTKDFWATSIELSPPVRKPAQKELTESFMAAPTVVEVAWLDGSECIVWTEAPPEELLRETIRQIILPRLSQ